MTITLDPSEIAQPATSPQTITEILEEARILISNPENWIKGAYAEDDKRWCSAGVVRHVCFLEPEQIAELSLDLHRSGQYVQAIRLLNKAVLKMNRSSGATILSLLYFNDHPNTTHADILTAFDYAIEESKNSSSQ